MTKVRLFPPQLGSVWWIARLHTVTPISASLMLTHALWRGHSSKLSTLIARFVRQSTLGDLFGFELGARKVNSLDPLDDKRYEISHHKFS